MPNLLENCDLVLKGGVTSGVVYPRAIYELSKKYRFQNIGGTSAGAIAAVMTAAAEYGREGGGFDRINDLPDALSANLLDKFQPFPHLKPLFRLFMALTGNPLMALLKLPVLYPLWALPGIVIGVLILCTGASAGSVGFQAFGLFLAVLLAYGFSLAGAFQQLTKDLPQTEYGMCPGTTQPGYSPGTAICDWMADTIDDLAGKTGDPLTVGDLERAGINIQTVTTDITTKRPYLLPTTNNYYIFSRPDFEKIFPKRIVDYMCEHSNPVAETKVGQGIIEPYFFKMSDKTHKNDKMPLVVLARMSLSFPLLFTAVPLYRRDYTFKATKDQQVYVKCHFSDGGLSSNFPVHLFDKLLPHTPTFGISLDDLDLRRYDKADRDLIEQDIETPAVRTRLPFAVGDGKLLPTHAISGLGSFGWALFDSAKDWQDSLQSVLTGFRERIVTVSLKTGEGGLNLNMPECTSRRLAEFGQAAGQTLVRDFKLEEHRWRRLLTEITALEETLQTFERNWRSDKSAKSYADLIADDNHDSYPVNEQDRQNIALRAQALADVANVWKNIGPLNKVKGMPKIKSSLRNSAKMGE